MLVQAVKESFIWFNILIALSSGLVIVKVMARK